MRDLLRHHRLSPLFVSTALLASLSLSSADELRFDRISFQQGLSQATVQAISRDRTGFIWFATLDGLDRFDGTSMKTFRPIPGDSTSLPRADVIALLTARDGTLWVGTNGGGLSRYNPGNENFTTYRHNPADPNSLAQNAIRVIAETRDGMIWIGTYEEGLDMLDPATGRFTHFVHRSRDTASISDNRIWSLAESRDGTLWVGTLSGLNRLDRSRGSIASYSARHWSGGRPASDFASALMEDPNGDLWVGTGRGLYRRRAETGVWTSIGPAPRSGVMKPDMVIYGICQDHAGDIWFGTSGSGLGRVSAGTGEVSFLRHDPLNDRSLPDDFIWTVVRDPDDRLWIGTFEGGVAKLDRKKQFIRTYRHQPGNRNGPGANSVSAVAVSSRVLPGRIWLGTITGGLSVLDPTGRKAALQFRDDPRTGKGTLFVFAARELRDGTMLIGTQTGVQRFDERSRSFVHLLSPPDRNFRTYAIDEAPDGRLWFATDLSGVQVLDRKTGALHSYSHAKNDPRSLSNNRVLCFCRDRSGVLWIGTDVGLNRYDPDTDDFTVYLNDPKDTTSLSCNSVVSIHEDGGGNLWLATYGGGVNRLGPARRGFRAIRERDGLASDVALDIQEDSRGLLWFGTTRGLTRFDPGTGRCRTFDRSSGFLSTEFNMHASFRAPSGELFFGGPEGLNSFFPDSLREDPVPPPVTVTSLLVFNTRRPLPVRDVHLDHTETFFAFEFAALDYTAPEKNQYAYRLEGIEPDWVYCGSRRYASYTHIPAGRYVFRVKGSNSDGTWNEEGDAVTVLIAPPYWETLWFRGLLVLAVIGAVAGLYNYRVRKLIEMERLRLRIAGDLHDEIGSNLSGIALAAEMVGDRLPRGEADRERLAQVSRSARSMVDAIREIVWFIRPGNDSLADLAEKMRELAGVMLPHAQCEFHFSIDGLREKTDVATRRNVFLIYKEALHNILRHAQATVVLVDLRTRGGLLVLRIADNGRGIRAEDLLQGNGMRNFRTRAGEIGGRVEVTRRPEGGTLVELEVKIA